MAESWSPITTVPGDPCVVLSGVTRRLYIKGLILLKGLGRERQAASVFERYLQRAPFGGERDFVERLLQRVRPESQPHS
jgi:hypothetical protein